jgi:hypothetical protein
MRLPLLFAFVVATTVAAAPANDVTLANWLKHPRVVAVRAIFEAVNADKTLRLEEKVGCDGNTARRVGADGVIRSVTEVGGEGAGEGRTEAYYDARGVLRFIISTWIDEAGTADDVRVYLDEQGKVFWHVARHGTAKAGRADFSASRFEPPASTFDVKAWTNAQAAFERTGCAEQP